MSDELKKFLRHELNELKQNKIRATALGVCFIIVIIFWASENFSGNEEIILNEPTTADAPPVTKDLPIKILPVEKSSDGVTLVLGANADALIISDPFAGEEKPKPKPQPKTVTTLPPIALQPPPQPQPQPQEEIILTGTAISGENKFAMFLRDKTTEFLTIGGEIGGRRIVDINPDFVTFADGGRISVQKELR